MTDDGDKLTRYLQPDAEEILISPEKMVCDSPLPGGNEGIGFEDWN